MVSKQEFTALKRFIWVLLVTILIIFSALFLYVPTQDPQLSIYSDKWDCLSKFSDDLETQGYKVSHISSTPLYLREIENPSNTVFIAIGLEREYSSAEVSAIINYLGDGGNVIIADDFGFGNSFIDNFKNYRDPIPFGLNYNNDPLYEFTGERVVDVEYKNDPDYPLIITETAQKFELKLNQPSGFVEDSSQRTYRTYDSENIKILAQTSSQSWLDINGNYTRDKGEISGPFPIILRYTNTFDYYGDEEYVAGPALIMISDPSIFINDMWDHAENRDFALYLINGVLNYGGEVIFDESIHINENYVYEAPNGFYIFSIYFIDNILAIVFIEFTLLIVMLIGVFVKKPKFKFQHHKDNLDMKKIYQMSRPKLDNFDYFWIRDVLMYKIRVGYDIDGKTFNSFDKDQIKVLLDDDYLYDYIYSAPRIGRGEMSTIVHRIINWKPKIKLLKMAKEMVLDAIIINENEQEPKGIIFKD